jgi:hypothetical protein
MKMSYSIRTISDKRGRKDFLELPYKIYRDDPRWVPPLRSETIRILDPLKNPFFFKSTLQKFVGYKDEIPVSRGVAIINRGHWKKFGQNTAFFGFFESIDDPEACFRLFDAMENFCRNEGAEFLEGPFNPNYYSELGLLTENFNDSPVFFETYNPEYYPGLIEGYGFEVINRFHTRINKDVLSFIRQNKRSVVAVKKESPFTLRKFNLLDKKADLERIREVYNDAFSGNWHFLPVSREEYFFTSRYLSFATRPELVVIVEHGDEPVGVLQCMFNINTTLKSLRGKVRLFDLPKWSMMRKSIREIVIYAIGIKKAYRNSAVFQLLANHMYKIAERYPVVYTSWMSEDNMESVRASAILGLKPYKWFTVYGKSLKKQNHEKDL